MAHFPLYADLSGVARPGPATRSDPRYREPERGQKHGARQVLHGKAGDPRKGFDDKTVAKALQTLLAKDDE